jgi:secreted trypsin-like serine protease
MIRKRVLVLVLSIHLFLPMSQLTAMENGFDAPRDGRTVPIIVPPMGLVCTGFLYSERIVFTAGHCLHNMESKQQFENVLVGTPNETYTYSSKTIPVVKSFVASNWGNFGWSDAINFNPTGEFGIYVLKQPIKVTGRTEVATAEKVKQLTDARTLVTNIAYGKQSSSDSYNGLPSRSAKFAEFPLVPIEVVKPSIDSALNFTGKQKYNMSIHVLQVPGGPSTCSGDSGSPIYLKDNDTYFYLGPVSNGIGGIPNCSGNPWKDSKMYMGTVAAHDYVDLIELAEKYVAENPYVEHKIISSSQKKLTLSCVKGKTIKKVSGSSPKCPKGFKQK